MRFNEDAHVFYCRSCGHISQEAKYTSSVTEWGRVSMCDDGETDYNHRDSETNDTDWECESCGSSNVREKEYQYAINEKDEHFDLTDEENDDWEELNGDREPPEPREGRNTLKCPEEVSSDT